MNLRRFIAMAAFLLAASELPAQIITNVVPPLGGHGDFIKILGNGFTVGGKRPNTLTVNFNNTLSTSSTNAVVSDSEIDITNVPTAATSGYITITLNGNFAQSPQPFVIVPTNMPYATNFDPIYGGNGTPVTITGVHFQTAAVTNLTFNGVRAASFFLNSDSKISATAPSGVTSGPLVLQSKLGATHNFSTISNALSIATNFFVQAGIASFSPASGRAGTNVIITGTNFTGISAVAFGGVPASDFTISNNTTIRAAVPANASTGKISVSPPSGTILSTVQSANNFSILPNITSFSPGSGPTNTQITVLGSGLNEKSPHPDVTVGGATIVTFGTISAGTLSFNVPANAASGPITITTTNGSITSAQLFYLPPVITSFTPTNGGLGTHVHIVGNNFSNASPVAFNGITGSTFVTNNTDIDAVVPAGVFSGTISVTTPFGTTNSTQLFYVAPTITDFSPTHGLPGLRVIINGTSFTNATAVAFNGTPAASFTVTNNNTLSAVVPAGVSTGKITVTAPGGIGTSAGDFTLDTADIGVTATDAPDPVFIGSNLVYTIVITNAGPVTALNVHLTNTLSQSVALQSASISQGTLATNVSPLVGTFGDLINQSSVTITLTVKPIATGLITNLATVSTDSLDPNPANNTATTVTTVWPWPFLSITNLMSNDLVRISWPAPLSGFTLQSTTNLSPSAWTLDTASRVVVGTNITVIETNLGDTRFYRLTN